MGNFIIDTRIKKLERIKQNLLTLKKNQRGDELTQVNGMIARLKKWNLELDKNVPVKTTPFGNYKPKDIDQTKVQEKEFQSTDHFSDTMEMYVELFGNKKDCHQDENTDTFCAMMRKIKEKKQ